MALDRNFRMGNPAPIWWRQALLACIVWCFGGSGGAMEPAQAVEPGCFNYVTCSFLVSPSPGVTTTCAPQQGSSSPLAIAGAAGSGPDEDSGTPCGAYQLWGTKKDGTVGWISYSCGYDSIGNICPSNN